MMSRPLGIVVVGLGRAGRARIRNINGDVLGDNVTRLVGVISRHKPDDMDMSFLSWDEALSNSDVDAFIISTENATHEEYAKKCIDAGKHVLVDFPLAISTNATKSLIEFAKKKGVVCHEEDIGLLTPAFKELMDTMKSKPGIIDATMVFTAEFNSSVWISDFTRAGFPSFAGVHRLHMLYELFGEMTVKEATITEESNKKEMVATLLINGDRPLVWTESRATGHDRTFTFHFKFEDGTTMDYSPRMGPPPRNAPPSSGEPPKGPPKGLFARDLSLFVQKVRGEVGAEELARETKRVVHCAEVAGKIEEMATRKM